MAFLFLMAVWRVFFGLMTPKWKPRLGAEKLASTRRTLFPMSARVLPSWATQLVFPTPPLMEMMPMVLVKFELLFQGCHHIVFFGVWCWLRWLLQVIKVSLRLFCDWGHGSV